MSKTSEYLAHAENCAELAAEATHLPTKKRYERMEAAWRSLHEEQRWLDGEIPPLEQAA